MTATEAFFVVAALATFLVRAALLRHAEWALLEAEDEAPPPGRVDPARRPSPSVRVDPAARSPYERPDQPN